jgi:hypothetical protein
MKYMKIMMAAALVVLTGCSKEVIEEHVVATQQVKNIGFALDVNEATRGLVANGTEMADLFIYDRMGGDDRRSEHITPAMTAWDAPSMLLDYGSHSLYFVASRGTGADEDDTYHKIVWTKPSDTFWATKAVTVNDASYETVSVTLGRVVTRLKVTVTDEVPAGIAKVVIEPATWYYGFNYITGDPVEPKADGLNITVPSSYVGTTGQLVMSVFGFSGTTEWNTDVTVTAYDGNDEVLGQVTLDDVPFKRNRTTEVSGRLFSGASATFDITLNDEWLEPVQMEW